MDTIIYCQFNIDATCVEVKYQDGSMISVQNTPPEVHSRMNLRGLFLKSLELTVGSIADISQRDPTAAVQDGACRPSCTTAANRFLPTDHPGQRR